MALPMALQYLVYTDQYTRVDHIWLLYMASIYGFYIWRTAV